jgi:hypothetical protein
MAPTMDNNRQAARQRVLKAGKILFGRAGSIDCTVRDLSERGARLNVASPIGIPDVFNLLIGTDPLPRHCRVAWRKAIQIGVEFQGLKSSDIRIQPDITYDACVAYRHS